MIIIFSVDTDYSTTKVIDWLDYYKAQYQLLKPSDVLGSSVKYDFQTRSLYLEFLPLLKIDEVNVVWNRKWINAYNFNRDSFFDNKNDDAINKSNSVENLYLNNFFTNIFINAFHLDRMSYESENKLWQLMIAKKFNLDVPASIVTTLKSDLLEFYKKNRGMILCKSVYSSYSVDYDGDCFVSYSNLVTESDIDLLPDNFMASLLQEYVEKEYEIRVFYFFEKLYSMCIFSQKSQRTKYDYRRYDHVSPNRNIPYILPKNIELKLIKLMRSLKLNSGSIDLIKTPGGKYVFLEVNPSGQYDMVSTLCNYNLDKIVALKLIEIDEKAKRNKAI